MKIRKIEEEITGEPATKERAYKIDATGCAYFLPKNAVSRMLTEGHPIEPLCGMCIHYGEDL